MFVQIDDKNKVIKNIPTSRNNIIKPVFHKLIISDYGIQTGTIIDINHYKPSGLDYIKKTDIELYTEKLKELPDGMKLVDGELIGKTLDEKLKTNEITQTEYDKIIQDKINYESLSYLTFTDWYAIRANETGKEIPADVLARRQEARNNIKAVKIG